MGCSKIALTGVPLNCSFHDEVLQEVVVSGFGISDNTFYQTWNIEAKDKVQAKKIFIQYYLNMQEYINFCVIIAIDETTFNYISQFLDENKKIFTFEGIFGISVSALQKIENRYDVFFPGVSFERNYKLFLETFMNIISLLMPCSLHGQEKFETFVSYLYI